MGEKKQRLSGRGRGVIHGGLWAGRRAQRAVRGNEGVIGVCADHTQEAKWVRCRTRFGDSRARARDFWWEKEREVVKREETTGGTTF